MTEDRIFERDELEQEIATLVESTHVPGRHAARSAIRHIEKAWRIAGIDPEMAAFRAITGEEESAKAVFHAIRRRGYPGAEKIKPRSHVDESALSPFMTAVWDLYRELDPDAKLRPHFVVLGEEDKRRLCVRFDMSEFVGQLGMPVPPLNFSITESGELHDFSRQLEGLAESAKAKSIIAHVRERANLRNRLLYASHEGVPEVTLGGFLERQRWLTTRNLAVFLMIDPYPDHQLFVSQAISAFLKMLNRIPCDPDRGEQSN